MEKELQGQFNKEEINKTTETAGWEIIKRLAKEALEKLELTEEDEKLEAVEYKIKSQVYNKTKQIFAGVFGDVDNIVKINNTKKPDYS